MVDIVDPFATEEDETNTSSVIPIETDNTEPVPVEASSETSIVDPFASDDLENTQEGEEDEPTLKEIAEEEPDAISTQMYSGLTYSEAREKYDTLMESPDVIKPLFGLGYAVYEDPETGRREYIPRPDMKMFGKNGMLDNTYDVIAGLLTGDLDRASTAFDDTEAKVDEFSKIALSLSESAGAILEAGAAGAEVLGAEGAVDAISPLIVNVDTGDSFGDAILTDAVPAVITSFGGGAAAQVVTKALPKVIRGFAVLAAAETGAAATTSTDEGTLFLGGEKAALIPIAQGLDLGDSKAEDIIEQRVNVLVEGMFLNSALSGVVMTTAQAAKLASKFTILPLLDAGREQTITRRIYDELTESLIKIDFSTTPQEIAEAKRELARIVEENKTVLLPEIQNLAAKEVPVDTLSALLRGTAEPEDIARISGVRAGNIQKASNNPQLIAASEGPARELQKQVDDRLAEISSEVPTEQVDTIAAAADELATDARASVASADINAVDAQTNFDAAAKQVVEGIQNADLELSGQISRLEQVTGTDIVTDKSASFDQIRNGLMQAKETMSKTKDDLYNAIPDGTPFDYSSFAAQVEEAVKQINLLDTSGTRTKSVDLINTIRSVLKPKEAVEDAPFVPFGVQGTTTTTTEAGDFAEELLNGGVDFKTLYNKVRPELSNLIDQAYKRGDDMVAKRLIDVKRAIDDQVQWVAENADEEAADAATKAYTYYSDQYAPVWRDGGVVADFGDLYEPVMTRGTQKAGFKERSRELVTSVLEGNNADAVLNMKTALEQVEDPKAIADYMITDVINGFASKVRSEGSMTPEALKGMSDRLQQYADSLNQAFPERAKQINSLVASIESAAGNKKLLEAALTSAEEVASQTRKEVKKTELGKFLSNVYGREMATNLNPEDAFVKIFRESEGIGTIQDIVARLDDMPPARASVVRDGMETAYLRYLSEKVSGAKVQSGGATTLKGANVDRTLEEANNILSIGREIYSEQPERMETFEILLDAARMIDKSNQATPVPGVSATAFNKEAVQATNRMIMTLIGPLNRTGAKIRSIAGATFDALDTTNRAQKILDNILADPERFLELAKKYDTYPMDPLVYENLITAITAGTTKAVSAEKEYMYDQNNVDQQMMDLVPQ